MQLRIAAVLSIDVFAILSIFLFVQIVTKYKLCLQGIKTVGSDGRCVTQEDSGLGEQPRDVLARDAPVHGDAHALVVEVISDR